MRAKEAQVIMQVKDNGVSGQSCRQETIRDGVLGPTRNNTRWSLNVKDNTSKVDDAVRQCDRVLSQVMRDEESETMQVSTMQSRVDESR